MYSRLTRAAASSTPPARMPHQTRAGRGHAPLTVGLVLAAALLASGCNSGDDQAPANRAAAPNNTAGETFKKSDDGSIGASPNPVAAGEGKGKTKVTWNTKENIGTVKIYVSENGQPESLVAQNPSGSLEVPWIQTGYSYEFRLYAEKDGSRRLLDKVQVTRSQ